MMKKLSLSGFDLGVIIAFVVLTLMGIGAWWYLSTELQAAVDQAQQAKGDFDKYSSAYRFVVSRANGKILQNNIDLLKAQLDPLIHKKFLPKENELHAKGKEDPVTWKHDLDDEIRRLTAAAKLHGVALPNNFYFGFFELSRPEPA